MVLRAGGGWDAYMEALNPLQTPDSDLHAALQLRADDLLSSSCCKARRARWSPRPSSSCAASTWTAQQQAQGVV